MSQNLQRLNKVLAQAGLDSRRSADELITSGKVTVNGQPAAVGQKVGPQDIIVVNGKTVDAQKPQQVVLAFYKPRGVTTTKADPHAKVTVMEYLPTEYQHLFPVGRLDRDSRGLLLMTNNGELALKLQHPRYEHEKEYVVTVSSPKSITQQTFTRDMHRLATQIIAPDAQTQPPKVMKSDFNPSTQKGTIHLILKEGKKRQIRRLMAALGYDVIDLLRVRIGKITLADLKEGEYRIIDATDLT